MKITGLALTPVVQPMQDKTWLFAKAQLTETHALLLELQTDDGVVGLGYAVQGLHLGEAIGGMRQVADELFRPILVGRDPFDIEALTTELDKSVLHFTRTKAAIETALFDVLGKALGLPVYKLLGGSFRTSIPVLRILPIKSPIEMARNAEAVVADGFRYLKVKVGLDPILDVERVRAIRSAVGPEVVLTLDANQGWTPKDAIVALGRMEPFDISIIEQPVRADDYAGLAQVRASTTILVEADESADSLRHILGLARANCVDAISLKTGKLGGLLAAKKGAAICDAANLRCRIGMAGASRLAAAADMHVIASTPNISFACEVGEFGRMETDPVEGLEIVDGELHVPQTPGLGVQLRTSAA
jgi:L-alanine-DL-glutamate epimerase-like enolase superfamily enzyme